MSTAEMKTKTMYMHTLDGKPARTAWNTGTILVYVGRGAAAPLFGSLAEIRQIQRQCQQTYAGLARNPKYETSDVAKYADGSRFGYVRVEVPADVL